nr:immunoglobulin heavy chain junction region [Macaca mulatta]MOV49623.1 immunoglobulin heavy chain junction region [Macaca mulatta]MOV49626.1 immunoglobulin heavy chain junction region [Macaca mulatta]MOV49921.1 immunoglobulin heavy chain junction region [Macaca mulatta]MOV49943.1 immunoglobulin heavy chain junction region [Macaca mulatta]
CTTREYW